MLSRKVKIVATLGPASSSEDSIKKMIEDGANVFRLNFSHGSQEQKKEIIKAIKKISEEAGIGYVGIIADMQGQKIRLGFIDGFRTITKGEKIILSTKPKNKADIPLQFDFSPYVKTGNRIFINDGLVELIVTNARDGKIETLAQNNGWISSYKGVNVPDTTIPNTSFNKKDRDDIQFSIDVGVTYIALSFIASADEIKFVRDMIAKKGSDIQIIVKIERQEAVQNLEEIIRTSDGVMVARGDLAIETKPESVPIIQQKIISISRFLQKPVIIATQMLGSMVENPRPTRAETSDVANAVLDQVDAVMLSEETASGKHPLEAVKFMRSIISSVEENPDYKNTIYINWETVSKDSYSHAAIASTASYLAEKIKPKAIVVGSATGKTAKLVASFRPQSRVIAAVHSERVAKILSLVWGVTPVVINPTQSFDEFITSAIEAIEKYQFIKKGDSAIFLTGSKVGTTGGTDTIKVVKL